MSRKFKLKRNCYGDEFKLYKKGTVTLNPGLTVLVGCNGIGKSTLLYQLSDSLKNDGIPCIKFDNLNDGGSHSVQEAAFYGNFDFVSASFCSSEGENIVLNVSQLCRKLLHFLETGETDKRKSRMARVFREAAGIEEEVEEKEIPKERWILLDAVDSGLSVDNVIDMKEYLFKPLFEHNFGNEIYIVISANEYEMANGEQCFDVHNGKYVTFKDYDEYRNFIIESRKYKDERYPEED